MADSHRTHPPMRSARGTGDAWGGKSLEAARTVQGHFEGRLQLMRRGRGGQRGYMRAQAGQKRLAWKSF
ncbi:UNVERIFIED_CONTAM: hypothetical protein K2H54_036775 [Gekko kuhli]